MQGISDFRCPFFFVPGPSPFTRFLFRTNGFRIVRMIHSFQHPLPPLIVFFLFLSATAYLSPNADASSFGNLIPFCSLALSVPFPLPAEFAVPSSRQAPPTKTAFKQPPQLPSFSPHPQLPSAARRTPFFTATTIGRRFPNSTSFLHLVSSREHTIPP